MPFDEAFIVGFHNSTGHLIAMASITSNLLARHVWRERQGYTEVRCRAGTQLGDITHTVRVFVKPLGTSDLDDYLGLVARDRPESNQP